MKYLRVYLDKGYRMSKNQKLIHLFRTEPNISNSDRGWIKNELNHKRKHIRNPPGKELAHERGREKSKGYSYFYTNLQLASNHRLQHKYDNMGKNNKERPYNKIAII